MKSRRSGPAQAFLVGIGLLAVIVLLHAGFHIWRHVRLRDNALRIMVPRRFHRYL